MIKDALIVVDMQNDFMDGSPLGVPKAKSIINKIANRIDEYLNNGKLIIATRDWHPINHICFARSKDELFQEIEINGVRHIMWPIHCVQNTIGADIVPLLIDKPWSKIINKGLLPNVDSFSAFLDNDKIHETGLNKYLQSKKVKTLEIVGVATDYCVSSTISDAINFGYKVTTNINLIAGLSSELSKQKLNELKEKGLEIVW
ncbi:hypothetical protein ASO20_01195 [Mycoplasma sp. (ex Biomphalaria glabrata)]|uniref:bifunctional nicotinamidase/pyrazinamidase n=1 Tax=Mycoplasma sp. (ex Biomphalaria glabrata) TaxID=1749074 RepID=UPI00073A959C|nr:bifunctional nicotinamidase/pyrazinamidase [Mycoplasma sp. (ex Biomphalaria glabrata)]ALV23274.1 hypothetical protein ASO20_01195 [Mycoplasma sp. (ex Biomphalaria glabrata)]